MAAFVRIDDAVIRNLLGTASLYADFPKFKTLNQKLLSLPKRSGCKCRRASNPGANILAEAKAYIQTLPTEKKNILKKHLNADYLKMMVTDAHGRHTEFTW
ncbi:MAG: hypothetical protein IJV70_07545 [Clostridia bacterium]|nr:hypothetical protein [Clostridia bacterium]